MKDAAQMNGNEKTWERLVVTYTILERARELELGQAGLSLPQAAVIYFLKTVEGPLTPSKLSRLIYKEPHTLSGLLSRMEAQGLVKKTKDLKRKNLVRVSLTKKGEESFKRQVNVRTVRNVTSCLSSKELASLNELLDKLYAKGIELLREMQPYPYGTTPH
ncbi:MAG: MarR family winged helix-turn-helix transcriptional regulator [Chloroflexi bacterium]|nr:MarR family winged helix-turn-helix transcriptional regulator [Chloroflexota bacterium]